MTTYRRGQVVVVEVPFSDQSGSKPRPALIVSAETFHRRIPDVIVCPISSQPRHHKRPGHGDCPLRNWEDVGLRHPSTVRISNILAIDKQIIKRAIGILPVDDMQRVDEGLMEAMGLAGRL